MSVGSTTVEAVVGSIIILAGRAYVIRHKAQISAWADSVFGTITQQTTAEPTAPTTAAPAPPTTPPTRPSPTSTATPSPSATPPAT
jgi:hypothetical protein